MIVVLFPLLVSATVSAWVLLVVLRTIRNRFGDKPELEENDFLVKIAEHELLRRILSALLAVGMWFVVQVIFLLIMMAAGLLDGEFMALFKVIVAISVLGLICAFVEVEM